MNKYKVTVYRATLWSFATQADNFNEFILESGEPLDSFAARLAREGFRRNDTEWIMPGAILAVERQPALAIEKQQ
jgi:hypothetical protein